MLPVAITLTSTDRLARHLLERHAEAMLAAGTAVWERPRVLSIRAWLTQLLIEAQDRGMDAAGGSLALTAEQEEALWADAIEADAARQRLLRPSEAVRHARDADATLVRWDAEPPFAGIAVGEDAAAFLRWRAFFLARCRRENWTTQSRATRRLLAMLPDCAALLPERVVLRGFEIPQPEIAALRAGLAEAGVEVADAMPGGNPSGDPASGDPASGPLRYAFSSAADEIRAAASWARALVDGGFTGRIGLVTPDLADCRDEVQRIARDVLDPVALLEDGGGREERFDMSLGAPLASVPVIAAALRILALLRDDIEPATLGAVLRSPFVAGADAEATARSLADARLRRRTAAPWTLRDVAAVASAGVGRRPRPALAMPRFLEAMEDLPSREPAAPSEWMQRFAVWLDAFGWPGDATASSGEYQARTQWTECMRRTAGLDLLRPSVTCGDALQALASMAEGTVFQKKAGMTRVQVLGLMESAGMEFDALWVFGMTADAWPRAPRVNPFLPYRLQERLGIPFATHASSVEFSQQLFRGLLGRCAGPVAISHPTRDKDVALRESPFCRGIPLMDCAVAPMPPVACLVHRSGWTQDGRPIALASLRDSAGPPLREAAEFPGAALITAQSDCPFRAFAEQRLGSAPLEEAPEDRPATVRGSLLHKALQLLWRRLGSSDALAALDRGAEEELLRRVTAELRADLKPRSMGAQYIDTEIACIGALLAAWLELERQRAPFRVVPEDLERSQQWRCGNVVCNIRIDRIDRLSDGRRVLLDYKSGESAPSRWFARRPEGAQMLLYAVSQTEPLAAAAYARVSARERRFSGLASDADLLPGVAAAIAGSDGQTHDLADALPLWEAGVRGLLAEFERGEAEVRPRDERCCLYCPQTPLCRRFDAAASAWHIGGGDDDA